MIKLLLLGSCVILTCILCNRLTSRIGVPMLFAFILLGMLFGSEGILHIPFDNFAFAENMCTIALIFIMFYGGFGTRWKAAKPVAGKALLLSSVGTVLTAVLPGAVSGSKPLLTVWQQRSEILRSEARERKPPGSWMGKTEDPA